MRVMMKRYHQSWSVQRARTKSMLRRICMICVVLGLGWAGASSGASLYDESVHGDLSGDRLSTTARTLAPGTNAVLAASTPGDLEYLTLTVPAGFVLDRIVLAAFDG